MGLMYSLITVYCGFKVLTGSINLWALHHMLILFILIIYATFWEPSSTNSPNLSDLDIYSDKLFYQPLFDKLKFPPRSVNSTVPIQQCYADLASSMQKYLEISTINLIDSKLNSLSSNSSCKTLYLGGGVALNCKLNFSIASTFKNQFNNIYAYPAGGDAGSSIGGCINYLNNVSSKPVVKQLSSAMLGSFS